MTGTRIFEDLESAVRVYSRAWPAVFVRASGSRLWDRAGRPYIDFFAGAGSLNYGHNCRAIKQRLIEYLEADGIVQGLDMFTAARAEFLEAFRDVILRPRALDYRIQFPGPAGTNAIEAALKLARNVTGRSTVVFFTNSFHGMTLGSLAASGHRRKRASAAIPLPYCTPLPYEGFCGDGFDAVAFLEAMLESDGSGVDAPAAILIETVQGEGGLQVASDEFLQGVAAVAARVGALLVVDDIQVGCGRTGTFFSFERAGISPDIVCLSKSVSGLGLPLALTLIKPQHDIWSPGAHNGTFRANNAAIVTAAEALQFWRDDSLASDVRAKSSVVKQRLETMAAAYPEARAHWRGVGLIQGLHCDGEGLAKEVCRLAFENGLLVETSGADASVIKVLPALTIDEPTLLDGLGILDQSLRQATAGARVGSEIPQLAAPH